MEATIVDGLIFVVVAGLGWFLNNLFTNQKRIEILVNRTREDYATRTEVTATSQRVMEALHRVEDKLDRILMEK